LATKKAKLEPEQQPELEPEQAFPSLEENLYKLKMLINVCYFQASEVLQHKEMPDVMARTNGAIELMFYLREMRAIMEKV